MVDQTEPQTPDPDKGGHLIRTDIVWLGSGRDGDPWFMGSWDVERCHCKQPWGHEALA